MDQTNTAPKLLKNTVFNFGGKLASYLAVLVLNPIILAYIGSERFGLWALVLLFAGYLGLVDLGFGAALTKYVAEYNMKKELYRINALFTAALSFYVLAFAVLTVTLWLLRFSLLRFFNVPEFLWNESQNIIPAAGLLFLLTSVVSVFQSLINGLQKMAITNGLAIVQAVLTTFLTIMFLNLGYGFYGVIVATLIALLPSLVALAISTRRLIPELRLDYPFRDRGFYTILRFSLTVQVARISGVVAVYADRVLIAHFLDLITLAKYQLGYTIIVAMRGITLLIASAVVPATSELCAREDGPGLRKLYVRGNKYSLIVGLFLSGLIITLAPEIIYAWLGYKDQLVVLVIRLLGVGHLFHVMTGMGTAMCEGLGKPGLEAKFGIWLTVMQIGFGVISVQVFGLLGILVSTAAVMATTSIVFLYQFNKSIGSGQPSPWWILVLKPVTGSILASFLVFGFSTSFATYLESYRTGHLLLLLIQTGIFVSAYCTFLIGSGYIDAFDKDLIHRIMHSVISDRSVVGKTQR
jgi:O-antigen/teichoic acid export membrane protein